jgi:hypothetical protein
MCFVDSESLTLQVSRRGLLGAGLVTGVALAASAGRSLLLPGVAEGAEPAPRGERLGDQLRSRRSSPTTRTRSRRGC